MRGTFNVWGSADVCMHGTISRLMHHHASPQGRNKYSTGAAISTSLLLSSREAGEVIVCSHHNKILCEVLEMVT